MILLTTTVLAVFSVGSALAQTTDMATVVIPPSLWGTTNPAPGTYTYANGTNIVLTAIPDAGYAFHYWVASGNLTPGHESGQPSYIIDPDTGEIIGSIPRPPTPSAIDNLVFTNNPATITCGYGYTYTYQAVFTPIGTPVPAGPTEAVVVILPTAGGTTDPAAGTHIYSSGTKIELKATPAAGYQFMYWVVSGNATPGHEPAQPSIIIDPDTGQQIASIPRPPTPTAIDSLVFTANPAEITCGYGYTYNYQAVFEQTTQPTSPPVSTPPPTTPTPVSTTPPITTTAPPATTPPPTPSPTPTPAGDSTLLIVAVVVIVIIIIIVIAAVAMRRKK